MMSRCGRTVAMCIAGGACRTSPSAVSSSRTGGPENHAATMVADEPSGIDAVERTESGTAALETCAGNSREAGRERGEQREWRGERGGGGKTSSAMQERGQAMRASTWRACAARSAREHGDGRDGSAVERRARRAPYHVAVPVFNLGDPDAHAALDGVLLLLALRELDQQPPRPPLLERVHTLHQPPRVGAAIVRAGLVALRALDLHACARPERSAREWGVKCRAMMSERVRCLRACHASSEEPEGVAGRRRIDSSAASRVWGRADSKHGRARRAHRRALVNIERDEEVEDLRQGGKGARRVGEARSRVSWESVSLRSHAARGGRCGSRLARIHSARQSSTAHSQH